MRETFTAALSSSRLLSLSSIPLRSLRAGGEGGGGERERERTVGQNFVLVYVFPVWSTYVHVCGFVWIYVQVCPTVGTETRKTIQRQLH